MSSDPPFDLARAPEEPLPGAATRQALPRGTRLQEFEIMSIVGQGGFGIVYLARDHLLERRVAVKEYMPWSLVCREAGTGIVTLKSEREARTFTLGLTSFLNEARLLAQFDHPALVKVYRFWEANGTAYLAMPFYEGPTLQQALAARTERPDEAWLRRLLAPLLDVLTLLHSARCFHRDIAPDNILLTPTGPLLLDLGAARRAIGDASQSFTSILKEGYAPVEQYAASGGMRQGAWTDIYALCGVIRYALTGERPCAAVDRLLQDHQRPLSLILAGCYSEPFLHAIDAGMAIKPEGRPQSIPELRALMDGHRPARSAVWLQSATAQEEPSSPASPAAAHREPIDRRLRWAVSGLLAMGLLATGYVYGPWGPATGAGQGDPSLPSTGHAPITLGAGFPRTADFYPDASRRLGETGLVGVRACVGTDGRLTSDPVIAQSSGQSRLDEAALRLARAASGHYVPATAGGKPVSSCFVLKVRF